MKSLLTQFWKIVVEKPFLCNVNTEYLYNIDHDAIYEYNEIIIIREVKMHFILMPSHAW